MSVDYPAIKNQQLARLRSGEYTMPVFLKEVAYWVLICGFDEIYPKPLPTKTDEVVRFEDRFRQMSELQRQNFDGMKFYADNPLIKSYYDQLSFIKHMNKSNLEWLTEIRGYMPDDDVVNHKKIEDRINRFKYLQDTETNFK